MLTNKKNWAIKKNPRRFYVNTTENPSCKIVNMIFLHSNDLLFYRMQCSLKIKRSLKQIKIVNVTLAFYSAYFS